MRDHLALQLIRLARKLTTWGFTEDYLGMAIKEQEFYTRGLTTDDLV